MPLQDTCSSSELSLTGGFPNLGPERAGLWFSEPGAPAPGGAGEGSYPELGYARQGGR